MYLLETRDARIILLLLFLFFIETIVTFNCPLILTKLIRIVVWMCNVGRIGYCFEVKIIIYTM